MKKVFKYYFVLINLLFVVSCSLSPSVKEINDLVYKGTGKYPDIRNSQKLAYGQVLTQILYLEPNCTSHRDYEILEKKKVGGKTGPAGYFEEYTWIVQACRSRWQVTIMFYPINGDIATNAGLINKIP